MQDFVTYFENLNYYAIIDLVVVLFFVGAMLFFLIRRNAIKMAIIYATYAIIFTVVTCVAVISTTNILYVTYKIMGLGWIFLLMLIAVVYQQDFKAMWGRMTKWGERRHDVGYQNTDDDLRLAASEIVKACQTLSKNDIGALIVITASTMSQHVLDTGTSLNAEVSSGLLQSIFNEKAPLHDGAVIIRDNRVLSAGCFLPLTQRIDINKELGSRHRAAIGITEESDVLAIVVSEETGIISTVKNGAITRYMTPEKLMEQVEGIFGIVVTKHVKSRKDKKNIF